MRTQAATSAHTRVAGTDKLDEISRYRRRVRVEADLRRVRVLVIVREHTMRPDACSVDDQIVDLTGLNLFNMSNQIDNKAPLVELASTEVNETERSATATVYGLMERTSVYRDGLGAVLINEDYDPEAMTLRPNRNQVMDTIPYPYGQAAPKDTVFPEVDMDQINKAIDVSNVESPK